MISAVPPAAIFILGSLLIPLIPGRLKSAYMLLLPLAAFVDLLYMPEGTTWTFDFIGYEIILSRVDSLSMVFGYAFVLVTFLGIVYALHVKDDVQHVAAFAYAGGVLGVTFSGDLFSLYVFWEIMAIASLFLVWARRTKASRAAGFRYFTWHFFGGICLLAGIILYVHNRGTAEFSYIGLDDAASFLIFFGFCLNAVVFPLHAWLPDAYPEATVTGAVFMSALTTKSAVYILARSFPGTDILIWAGAIMAVFPILYAVLVNDTRRVLAYALINQQGFMICGVGIGTQLAMNGAASHAFCCVIYSALLFMATGAVLHMTGKIRATDLGGLYRSMPFTAVCCVIGAASIAALPLFSGFISKSMTVSAAAEEHLTVVWFMLQLAAAGACLHAGLKVPYVTFFGRDSGIRTKEPPLNMRAAMGLAAAACIGIGVYPDLLYSVLPFPVEYTAYTAPHVLEVLELVLFGALGFMILVMAGYYPSEARATIVDTDVLARLPGRAFVWFCTKPVMRFGDFIDRHVLRTAGGLKKSPGGSAVAETGMDAFFHKWLAALPTVLLKAFRPLRTEKGYLPWNLIYILLSFIGLLIIILLAGR